MDPTAQNYLALKEAIKYGRSEVVDLLLDAEPISEDQSKIFQEIHNALETARKTGHEEFYNELKASGKLPQSVFDISKNGQHQTEGTQ